MAYFNLSAIIFMITLVLVSGSPPSPNKAFVYYPERVPLASAGSSLQTTLLIIAAIIGPILTGLAVWMWSCKLHVDSKGLDLEMQSKTSATK